LGDKDERDMTRGEGVARAAGVVAAGGARPFFATLELRPALALRPLVLRPHPVGSYGVYEGAEGDGERYRLYEGDGPV
jgi:hypothetical protein